MQKKQYTPQQLANLLASGNPADILVLYDMYSAPLYNILLTMLHNADDAQQILCHAFAAIRTDRHTYNPAVSAPFTWMLRKAVATAMAYSSDKVTATARLKKAFIGTPVKKINRPEPAFSF